MNESKIEAGQPGTTVEQSTKDDGLQVSQANANTNVHVAQLTSCG